MSTWLWLVVAVAVFLSVSLAVSLVIGAILGQIGREVSDLLERAPTAPAEPEAEAWASAPLAREANRGEGRSVVVHTERSTGAVAKTHIV
jgi:hypothetical protein